MNSNAPFHLVRLLTPKAMTRYLSSDMTLRQALEKFAVHRFSQVPILNEEGEYVSSISEGDILYFLKENNGRDYRFTEGVNIMDVPHYRDVLGLSIDASFEELYRLALSQNYIPISDDRTKFIGIVKRKDVFVYLKEEYCHG